MLIGHATPAIGRLNSAPNLMVSNPAGHSFIASSVLLNRSPNVSRFKLEGHLKQPSRGGKVGGGRRGADQIWSGASSLSYPFCSLSSL